ncbi:MAG: hypothetical protein AAF337_13205 [Pseudomonadota bacterium]
MDIQASSSALSAQTAATGSASSVESAAKAKATPDLAPPVKVEGPSADVPGGKVIDIKV